MKRRSIIFIIITTSLALAGIVSMQLFWMKNAMKLKEKQFDHRVSIALKSVINQLGKEQGDSSIRVFSCKPGCESNANKIIGTIPPERLDSLLKEEFENLCINQEYKYGICNKPSNIFTVGDYKGYEQDLLYSHHFTSLTCLLQQECSILYVYFPDEENFLLGQMIWWLSLSAVFLIIVIIGFSFVIMNLFRQKRLSEMKSDFVNNMTHEFKTPIATISLASEMLLKPTVHDTPDKTIKYANIIYDENNRLKNQVEQVLQIAVLDRGTFKLKKQVIHLHEVIRDAAESFEMIVKQREGKIELLLEATHDQVKADPVHITNIIHNLFDNANKYSPEIPVITVKSRNDSKGIFISVADQGIGISKENQKHIFRKFYRVHTGNIHDVKGFGLGLFYVKTIVDEHGGSISVHSDFKKGSIFEIFLPTLKL